MALHWPSSGPNLVGEYQVAGHIFAHTGSTNVVRLNYLAKSITPLDTASITFYDSGSNATTYTGVPPGTRIEGKILTFKCTVGAVLEITNIPSGSYFPPLTESMKRS